MQDKRYIICGNAPTDGIEENPDRDLRLRLWGKDGPDKITLRIEDIHKKMSKDVPLSEWIYREVRLIHAPDILVAKRNRNTSK